MKIKELFKDTNYDIEIKGIASFNEDVEPNFLFITLPGKNYSGIEFINDVIKRGAACIVTNEKNNIYTSSIPIIYCKDELIELKRILNIFYQDIYNNVKLIGVTGTDGKTTISTLTSFILSEKYLTGVIGTNGIHSPFFDEETSFTTPTLSKIYSTINKFLENNITHVSMEVSSEGILNNRIDTLLFDYAIFSNLSCEHLNTHKTMHNYFSTKFRLFNQLKPGGIAIVNKDDNYSRYFESLDNVIYYSLFMPSDYQAINIKYFENYSTFDLITPKGILKQLKVNRTEEYNIYNIIPAIIISLLENVDISSIYSALLELPQISGRMEKIPTSYPFDIYVDFAHTPNGLKNMLLNIRKKTRKKLILVCGAAGHKDKIKRPEMGRYATEFADMVIFTSEDPRTENPVEIINDLTSNTYKNNYEIILNRKKAIDKAISVADKNDIIVISGKGKEDFFEQNNIKYHYSDFEYVLNKKPVFNK